MTGACGLHPLLSRGRDPRGRVDERTSAVGVDTGVTRNRKGTLECTRVSALIFVVKHDHFLLRTRGGTMSRSVGVGSFLFNRLVLRDNFKGRGRSAPNRSLDRTRLVLAWVPGEWCDAGPEVTMVVCPCEYSSLRVRVRARTGLESQ